LGQKIACHLGVNTSNIKAAARKSTILWALIFVLADITSSVLVLILLINLFAVVVYIWSAFLDPSFRDSFFDGIKIIDHNIIFAIPIHFSELLLSVWLRLLRHQQC
jgi:hypothetical protein